MHWLSPLVLVLLVALGGCKKSRQHGSDEGDGPALGLPAVPGVARSTVTTWPSDAKLSAQLDDPVEIMGYQIRPPKGYTYVTRGPGITGVTETAWLGDPVQSDRIRPKFAVSVYPFGSDLADGPMIELREHLRIESARPRLTFADVEQLPAEFGQIYGLRFGRVRWTGKDFFKRVKAAGSVYAAIDDRTLLWMTVEDEDPAANPQSIALAEESFLTFRKAERGTKPLDLKKSNGGRIAPGRPDDLPIGNLNGPQQRAVAPAGGMLIGFDVGLVQYFPGVDAIGGLRPIYRAGGKDVAGEIHGSNSQRWVRALAKPGYAVGTMKMNSGLWIDGLSFTFMKVAGDRLDPRDSYESDWMGGKGGQERKFGGDGTPVAGISYHIDNEKRVCAIGLVYQKP